MLYSELFASALKKLDRGEMSTAVEVLIESSFGISRSQFWIRRNEAVHDPGGLAKFRHRLRRLFANEPLAYILGEKEFYGETFAVSPAVLIPRPETELLVEKALEILGQAPAASSRNDGTASSRNDGTASSRNDGTASSRNDGTRVLDVGAGSGCISIVLALKSRAMVTAIELSHPALRVLKKNIARFGLDRRVRPLSGDLFPRRTGLFHMIVSNPPYLSSRDWREAPAGVRRYEPKAALVAGPKGTEILARIVALAPCWLAPGGWLLLEIGQGQRPAVCGFLKAAGLRRIECVRDYGGIERVIVACRA